MNVGCVAQHYKHTLKCKLKCYVKPMKDPLGVSPGKGNQGTTRGKENFLLTSVGIEPTNSGLDLPLLCMGLSWVSHSSLIYTSELILCSTICVHGATWHSIQLCCFACQLQSQRQSGSVCSSCIKSKMETNLQCTSGS